MNETPHRILVVDDEPSITEFVGYALRKEGYNTDVVDNGEDALVLAAKNNYDLFVLDIMLPGIDGYELCRRLRAKTTVPVLFLSAHTTQVDLLNIFLYHQTHSDRLGPIGTGLLFS